LLSPGNHRHEEFITTTIVQFSRSDWDSTGIYYEASSQSDWEGTSLEEAKQLLHEVRTEGASIQQAWFQKGQSGCATPYGASLQMVVPPKLVVQLNTDTTIKALSDFQRTKGVSMECPYYIVEITPSPE